MDALYDQGMFWLVADKKVNFHIPEDTVSGNLSVSEEGVVSLVLNGVFRRDKRPDDRDDDELLQGQVVLGVLKGGSKRVILMGLSRGSWRYAFGGFSYEEYRAKYCLAGGLREISDIFNVKVSGLSIDLSSYQDWLGYEFFSPSKSSGQHSVDVKLPRKIEAKVAENVRLVVEGNYYGGWEEFEGSKKLALHASVIWRLRFNRGIPLKEALDYFRSSAELLMLLADSGTRPGWPEIQVGRGKSKRFSTFYFYRHKESDLAPREHYGFVYYQSICFGIGSLYESWLKLRNKVGSGSHLYFQLLNPGQTYIEHMYVSAIWGLENYHRRQYGDLRPGKDLRNDKIKDELDSLTQLKPKEIKTLKKSVDFLAKFSLQERLVDLFRGLPLNLEKKSLLVFCKECADRRNDLSHYGGYRKDEDSDEQKDFNAELVMKIMALKYLYGALLLGGIGVSDQIIKDYFYNGRNSSWVNRNFKAAGLKLLPVNNSDS